MQRFTLLSFTTAGLLFLATSAAHAQYYGRGAYSQFGSPYGGYGGAAGIVLRYDCVLAAFSIPLCLFIVTDRHRQ